MRWFEVVSCVAFGFGAVTKSGKHNGHPHRQRYRFGDCERQLDDLTGSLFEGRHQPLRIWVGCLYLLGLNLSTQPIFQELDWNKDDVPRMASELRKAIAVKRSEVKLSGQVEFNEV